MSVINVEGKKRDILNLSPLDEDSNKISEEPKKKVSRRSRPTDYYKGPLRLVINNGVTLSEEAKYFVDFMEGLGQNGYTFEELFQRVKDLNDPEITYTSVTHKFYTIRAKGNMSFKWMTKIVDAMGYEVELNFIPKPNPESFKEEVAIEEGMYEGIIDLEDI